MFIERLRRALGGGRRRRERLTILMYHTIAMRPPPVANWCVVELASFESQMEYLARECKVLPLSEVLDRIERDRTLPERTVCLTFDDGFRSVASLASPILARRQLPATVFLVTGTVGSPRPAWADRVLHALSHTGLASIPFDGGEWPLGSPGERARSIRGIREILKAQDEDRREADVTEIMRAADEPELPSDSELMPLSWEEVDHLHRQGGWEFGSHTHSHTILARCRPERQLEELRRSRDILLERIGRATLFAYPNGAPGDFDAVTRDLLARCGYRCALTATEDTGRWKDGFLDLGRFGIGNDTTHEAFVRRLEPPGTTAGST